MIPMQSILLVSRYLQRFLSCQDHLGLCRHLPSRRSFGVGYRRFLLFRGLLLLLLLLFVLFFFPFFLSSPSCFFIVAFLLLFRRCSVFTFLDADFRLWSSARNVPYHFVNYSGKKTQQHAR